MEKVLQRRDEEDLRSRKFLHPSSYGKVRSECEQRMVADHLAAIQNECLTMVQLEFQQDLRNSYALLKVKTSFNTLEVQALIHFSNSFSRFREVYLFWFRISWNT
jgi:hypothetical protein